MSRRPTTLPGVLVSVAGHGLLIAGQSGTGKSQLALTLIARGHRLVADDAPEVRREGGGVVGAGRPGMSEFLAVRALGILNVRRLYGDQAVAPSVPLTLILRLDPGPQARSGVRLRPDYLKREVLGVEIPELCLAHPPGEELTVLAEAAVRDAALRASGYDAAADFEERQRRLMEQPP